MDCRIEMPYPLASYLVQLVGSPIRIWEEREARYSLAGYPISVQFRWSGLLMVVLYSAFFFQVLHQALWFPCTCTLESVQFSSVAQSCLTLCDPMNRSMPGLPVHHHLLEFTQTHIHWVRDAIQPSHPRLSPSPTAPNPSQHQSLFQWVSSSHEVAKVLEFQLQH